MIPPSRQRFLGLIQSAIGQSTFLSCVSSLPTCRRGPCRDVVETTKETPKFVHMDTKFMYTIKQFCTYFGQIFMCTHRFVTTSYTPRIYWLKTDIHKNNH